MRLHYLRFLLWLLSRLAEHVQRVHAAEITRLCRIRDAHIVVLADQVLDRVMGGAPTSPIRAFSTPPMPEMSDKSDKSVGSGR